MVVLLKEGQALKWELGNLQTENQDLKNQVTALQEEVADLRAQLKESQTRNKQLEVEKEDLIKSLQTQVEAFKIQIAELLKKNEQLANEIAALKREPAFLVGKHIQAITHDMKNFLGGVESALDLITYAENKEELSEYMNLAKVSAENLRELLYSSLNFLKNGDQNPIYFDPVDELKKLLVLINTLGCKKHFKYNFEQEVETKSICAIPSEINRVVLCLCTNAYQAMQLKDTLSLNVDLATIDAQDASLKPGEYVRISVADTGSGIPAENLSRIFEADFTTKKGVENGGSGIGLSHSLAIVKKYGGDIRVKSTVGEGSTFEVLLPLVDSETMVFDD